jgi:hypothetical protein
MEERDEQIRTKAGGGMNSLACPYGSRSWCIPSERDDSDALERWTATVRADETWMQIEAADVMARFNPDGEVVREAFDACWVLRKLLEGHTLTEACAGRKQHETAAAVALLKRLIGLGVELDSTVRSEAERRIEQAEEQNRLNAEAYA